uniref:Structural maintenance of chromosomes protein 5 n=1 Tax=Piliocolobus tephrosceles TaxID=591936 RepID=A0A8C9HC38_9PRIM
MKEELNELEKSWTDFLKKSKNLKDKKKEIFKNIVLCNEKKINICNKYVESLKVYKKYDKEIYNLKLLLQKWKKYLYSIKNENNSNEKKHEELKSQIEQIKKKYALLIEEIKCIEEKLKREKENLTAKELETLANLNMTYEEVVSKLNDIINQQKMISTYEQDEQKYNNLITLIEKHKENVDNKKKEMEQLKINIQEKEKALQNILPSWSNKINEYIHFLNYNFFLFMNFINPFYGGKIELVRTDNSYEKCQLFIKVKFKENASYLPLSISHQSGGERSLTTMLFILAIQKLTKNGFYVLDELNQGLDYSNEKKIFELLTCLSNPKLYEEYFAHSYEYKYIQIDYHSKPQYFILSP